MAHSIVQELGGFNGLGEKANIHQRPRHGPKGQQGLQTLDNKIMRE
jgi:hypothetical protein